MRVSWPIVTLGILVTVLLTWHLRTRHYDFMTPDRLPLPPEDFGADLVSGIPKVTPTLLALPAPAAPELATSEHEDSQISQITETDLGDLGSSPGLDEYRDFARREGPSRLLDLSSKLQALGQSQRAMLALERVIDSTNATPDQVAQAAAGITALSSSLPKWIIDPEAEITLTLHLSSTQKAPDALKQAALDVATHIRQASGDQLDIIPKVTSREGQSTSKAITLQFATSKNSKTPVLALNSLLKEGAPLTDELAKATFRMVRAQLTTLGYSMPETFSPRDLSEGMTRLMWRDYTYTLIKDRSAELSPPPKAKKGETSEEQN